MDQLQENPTEMPEYSLMADSEQDLDEKYVLSYPWALNLMRTVKRISKQSVLNWCDRVIKLGEDTIDVDEWTTIFASHVERTFEELINDVWNLQNKALNNIQDLLKKLEQLSKDLHVPMPKVYKKKNLYEEQRFLMKIIEEYETKVIIKRKEFHELRDRQLELCKNLEKEPIILPESPLPTPDQLNELQKYIENLEEEKFSREEKYMQLKDEIVKIMNELKIDATLDYERELLSTTLADFPVTETNMKQLENHLERLSKNLKSVKEEISHLRSKVDNLWEMLDVDIIERDTFRQQYAGNSLQTLNALKNEYKRLEDLKKANLKMFIDKRREDLSLLWEKCHCDGAQKSDFQFLYSDVYSEDLLELHEREIHKWNRYYEANEDLIKMIEEHKLLWDQLLELERNAESVNRYKNRGGQLLLEEKARNKLSKEIPKLEQRMEKAATNFNFAHGYPFKTFGKTIEEYIQVLHDKREEEKRLKSCSKKNRRDNTNTPAKSYTSVLPCSSNAGMRTTPLSTKAKTTPGTNKTRKMAKFDKIGAKSPGMPPVKVTIVGPARRLSSERRRRVEAKTKPKKMPLKVNNGISEDTMKNCDNTNTTEYDTFERDLSSKDNCRSTVFQLSNSTSDQEQCSSRKRKAKTPNKAAPRTPKTPKMDYLRPPVINVENLMPRRTPSKVSGQTPLKPLTRTPSKTPLGTTSSTPLRTPGRTPNTQRLRAATSSLKLVF